MQLCNAPVFNEFQVLWLRLTFEPKAPSVMQPKAVLSANNCVSCRLVIWQGSGQCWGTGDFLMAWRQVCWQTFDKQHLDVQCADLMLVSLAILQEKSTHRYHRYPNSFAGGLGAMAPYDASEEVAPPFQSLYFSNVPWQVARYHQNPRCHVCWDLEYELSPKMVDSYGFYHRNKDGSMKSYPPEN